MKSTDIDILIGRVLSGEANAHERYRVQQWRAETEENQVAYEKLRQLWQQTTLNEELSNADRVYRKILEKRAALTKHRMKKNHQRKPAVWKKAGVAASLLLMVTMAYWWSQSKPVTHPPAERIAWVVKENPAGQKSKILLADGTIVWLNAESTLRYQPNFNDSVRSIALVGEAYFQVARDSRRPFVVASGDLQTTALGTSFNVRHFAGDSVAVVFLEEGKVDVVRTDNPGTSILLEPGNGVVSRVDRSDLRKFNDRAYQWTSWKDGVLLFNNASLHEVIKTCERWYSVTFSIHGSPPSDWKFTGRFENEPLENVLESLTYGKSFDYTIQDKQVELHFKP